MDDSRIEDPRERYLRELNEEFKEIIGLTLEEAEDKLGVDRSVPYFEREVKIRVQEEDGRSLAGTMDFRPERINVATQGGKITSILGRG